MRAGSRAYHALREDILEWRLPPGTPLGEVEQAQRLGVSRTPVREALARLAADGLVRGTGARGAVVADLSPADVRDLFDLRIAVETRLARLAAQRRDPGPFRALAADLGAAVDLDLGAPGDRASYYDLVQRLDDAIDTAAASRLLSQALDGVRLHLRRLRRVARDHPDRLRESASEHLSVTRAILDSDAELAAAATLVHLRASLGHILHTYEDDPARPLPTAPTALSADEPTARIGEAP
ncbi:GntR family transcriptional regulator [Occultella glacieicola]|uniref:GntR family transcriptional regulator n=1 Tax=Occultella glacieicola TaxID=2518684 RepID=A0ABY2E0C2_9MICO|nr:GntR family transcriptional regulator [Occultella glacieicola]TDE89228.1 GntR family transcriptional regulator [Occultella glacieicola]